MNPITIKGIKKPFTAKKDAKKVKMCYNIIAKQFGLGRGTSMADRFEWILARSIEGVCVFCICMAAQQDSMGTKC